MYLCRVGLVIARVGLVVLLLLPIIGAAAPAAAAPPAQPARKCFDVPLIEDCIAGRFLEFWEANGGLAVFGYPISPAFPQVNEDTGQTYLTQYFERQRFELHPENAAPYDVLLGLLGKIYEDWAVPSWREMDAQARSYGFPQMPYYFEETRQNVGEEIAPFWSTHGLEFDGHAGTSRAESVALFGMPLRAEVGSSARAYRWQPFERANLEWHEELPGQPVLGKRLGVWYMQSKCLGRLGANLFTDAQCQRVAGIAYP